MKKSYLLLQLLILLLFNGCRVLTKSQIKSINTFATTAKKYSYFPGEVIKKRADLVLEEKITGAIQLPADQIKLTLSDAQQNFELQQRIAGKFDLSLQLIRQYAGLLTKLSSPVFVKNLAEDTNALEDNLSGLVSVANTKLSNRIPVNVAGAITKAVFLAGQQITKSRQAKALKEFIPRADTLVKITMENITDVLTNDLPGILSGDKQKFINTYTNNILVKANKVDYNSLKQYVIAINNYENLEQLRKKCIRSAVMLLNAHSRLSENIRTRSNVKKLFEETRDLVVSIQDLNRSIGKLSPNAQF